jgi:hypothetical protein
MTISLLGQHTHETYKKLEDAVAGAKTWFLYLEKDGVKLPSWDYKVESVADLQRAVARYKARLAAALGIRAPDIEIRLRLTVSDITWGRP